MVQRCPYVSQHGRTGECRCDCATSEISLRDSQQMVVITFSKTRFESLGEAGGQLYGRKIPEKQKRSTDFGIVLRAALAFSEVPLHAYQLDPGQGIVYERDVLITKLATIHGDRLRVQ